MLLVCGNSGFRAVFAAAVLFVGNTQGSWNGEMTAFTIVYPLAAALLVPLVISVIGHRWQVKKAGPARGRSVRVQRAMMNFAVGIASAITLLIPGLITRYAEYERPFIFVKSVFIDRPLAVHPYLTLCIVVFSAAAYGIASYRIWRHYNPVPVVSILLPIHDGLLVIRRGTPPATNMLAFPGGYVEEGESWQMAAVRELHEETGIVVHPDDLDVFWLTSTRRGHLLIIYVLVRPSQPQVQMTAMLSREVSELRILMRPISFVWDQDTAVARRYFKDQPGRQHERPETVPYIAGV